MTIPAKELYEVVWHMFQVTELCLWPIINYNSLNTVMHKVKFLHGHYKVSCLLGYDAIVVL